MGHSEISFYETGISVYLTLALTIVQVLTTLSVQIDESVYITPASDGVERI